MRIHSRELRIAVLAALCSCAASAHPAARQAPAAPQPVRPFGTLRELAAMQQRWLRQRLDTFLPPLMRKHGLDVMCVPGPHPIVGECLGIRRRHLADVSPSWSKRHLRGHYRGRLAQNGH